ncbi:MAG: MmgE/PrpD family protein [Actinomycetota bacterium]|nr:MmgE/PrpD family protein [Actinomycetota bacterium]
MPSLTEELSSWASGLTLDQVPDRVVRYAKSQIISQLAAARAGMAHPLGQRVMRAFGRPFEGDGRQTASALAGLAAWLQFDDTAYAGHLSQSTVNVPVGYAGGLGLDGTDLLTAVVAANECAARITAAATLGPLRGQSAAHTNLAGAVGGRMRSEAAPAARWVDGFGLAFAMAPWPVQHGLLASDAKALIALTPLRMGLDACDAAAAGLSGAPDILEHPDGFLARFATVALPEAVVAGLGERWHTETLSFKTHPGGPGVDAAIDAAMRLHHEMGDVGPDEIAEVVVDTSLYTVALEQRVSGYIHGARSPLGALVLSVPYTVATTLLVGELVGADFTRPRLEEPERWALADKVRVGHDLEQTRASMLCVAPFGEAIRQAGPRAGTWLEEVGGKWLIDLVGEIPPPSATFEDATKVTGARVAVRLFDGRCFEHTVDIPVGAAGPDTRARHPQLVAQKFSVTGGRAEVADALADLEHCSAGQLRRLLTGALYSEGSVGH